MTLNEYLHIYDYTVYESDIKANKYRIVMGCIAVPMFVYIGLR